jgi:hypothetical protein
LPSYGNNPSAAYLGGNHENQKPAAATPAAPEPEDPKVAGQLRQRTPIRNEDQNNYLNIPRGFKYLSPSTKVKLKNIK